MPDKLVYNAETDDYECEYDGKTLYVDGDAWDEHRLEQARARLSERHPDLSQDEVSELLDSPEGEQVWEEVTEEELDAEGWAIHAIEVGQGEERPYTHAAWIQ